MKLRGRVISALFVLALFSGCSSAKVTDATPIDLAEVPRPNQIYVYDFIADPAMIPADSAVKSYVSAPSTPPTAKELENGRKLGAIIAKELATKIRAMGLSAVQADPASTPQVGDGFLRGYLISVQGGSAAKRFVVGFGAGASELETVVEGYTMTAEGPRRVGSGKSRSSAGKTPGMVVPAAVALAAGNPVGLIVVGGIKAYDQLSGKSALEGRAKATAEAIAQELKIRFRKRGWIS